MSIQAIKKEVNHLSKSEQKELLHYMVEVIAGANDELSLAWKREIDDRIAAYKRGEMQTYSRSEALKFAFRR
ncbi:MAG: addiction module protein [Bacteroidota bacterium]